ncbi:two-component regulator propeller domain-containing protein [Arenibacter sp. M-2]|uniref:hybrid sensor histidine kinase/response regulator transcription factor n=1 Tax=Arenibacter sp. M-2 TaxID=3053612 RepID=UPI00257062A7|nr:two-component regulator propeller domain-containing protein [Arenibacter sp. M-2]MDL5513947.1 two-component regulator propeller domain-containing protein [Arenibacter sp. M-2]
MKFKVYLLILFFSLIIFTLYGQAENRDNKTLKFKHFSIAEGLSQSSVLEILQDNKGFLWFGTRDGLNKYDGHSFKTFRHNSMDPYSISNSYIKTLLQDEQGTLWVGTNYGLNRYLTEDDRFDRIYFANDNTNGANNEIWDIVSDDKENLWVGTNKGLLKYKIISGESILFQADINDPNGILHNEIRSLLITGDGILWICNTKNIDVYNPETKRFKHYYYPKVGETEIVRKYAPVLCEDQNRNIWLGDSNGLSLFNKEHERFETFSIVSTGINQITEEIRSLEQDYLGNLWVGTYNGLYVVNTDLSVITHYVHDENVLSSLSQNSIYKILEDTKGDLWIGTYAGGVNYYDRSYDLFKGISSGANNTKLNYKVISSIIEDDAQNLWIATEGGGVNFLNRKTGSFTYYTNNKNNPNSLSTDNVKSMIRTNDGNFWIGTHDGGLNYLNPNKKPFKFVKFKNIPGDSTSLSNNRVISLFEDYQGNIWIGTSGGGLNVWDKEKKSFQKLADSKGVLGTIIYTIVETSDNNVLLVGGSKGLAKVNLLNRTIERVTYKKDEQDIYNMNAVLSVYEDPKQNLWIGTEGDGLYYYVSRTKSSVKYGLTNGLPNEVVYGILPDDLNYLWLSTNNGLSRLDLTSFQFKNFDISDGLLGNEFNYGSYTKLANKDLVFGGTNGFNYFNPDDLVENTFVPPVNITAMQVNNKPFVVGDFMPKSIKLNYNQNDFNFNFVALSFSQPNKNQYAYKLEGFDEEWIYIGNKRSATYTNLDSGDYVFRVKASNSDGLWNEKGASVKIKVLSAPWATWWAYLVYFLFIAGVVVIIRRFALIRIQEKNALKQERLEKERIEEINQMKLRLFTNISHDFRTPLTLIIGPLERLLTKKSGDSFVQRQHEVMHRNASVLLQLINQLLDFRKSESGKIQLQATKDNIVPFIENIKLSFEELARIREIDYSFQPISGSIELFFDKINLNKIIFNLLSNAFKFTPDKGRISITLTIVTKRKSKGTPAEFLRLVVEDSGKGISKRNQKFIFDRFFQLGQDENNRSGTGIGLAITKSLVELHHGTIKAKSKVGQGTAFVVLLPMGKDHLSEDQIISGTEGELAVCSHYFIKPNILIDDKIKDDVEKEVELMTSDTPKPSILLVEDNKEVRSFIKTIFERNYNILEAENGANAIEIASKQKVDLIISDVMMPTMDGIELCSRIKSNIVTSHIPVLLLTAKTSEEAQKSGFTTGADAYITKPFVASLLELRVNNMLNSRKLLIEKFKKDIILEPKELTATSADELFLQKAINLVEENISNQEFTINDFIFEMNMSRSALYRKLKALTNQSISEFIKTVKIKRAGQLILQSQLNISEIAFDLGFNDLKHFRKSFQNVFNELPSEYRSNYSGQIIEK